MLYFQVTAKEIFCSDFYSKKEMYLYCMLFLEPKFGGCICFLTGNFIIGPRTISPVISKKTDV